MYNFDLQLYINNEQASQSKRLLKTNKQVKSISTQRNLKQMSSDFRCITDESPSTLQCFYFYQQINKYQLSVQQQQIPILGGSVTERQLLSLQYRPSIVHRYMYSENQFEKGQQRKFVRQMLPSIIQGYSVHELSQNRMSIESRMSPSKYKENKKSITEIECNQTQKINDHLSIKKLNDLLGHKKICPEKLRQDFPSVPEIQDFSKKMEQIYKKNNINPLKLRSPIPMETSNKNTQHIDILINLLKKRKQ